MNFRSEIDVFNLKFVSSIDKTTTDSPKIKLFFDGVNLNPPEILVRSKTLVSVAPPEEYLKISIDLKKILKIRNLLYLDVYALVNVTVLLQQT